MPRGYPGRIVSPAEATRRWRLNNPEAVKASGKARSRVYNSEYRKKWWASLDPLRKALKIERANDRATKVRRWLDARIS